MALFTHAMEKRHEIKFKSYDRLFPNQDTMPKGGMGNLIALPMQKRARENNNSVFIDEYLKTYEDQWSFLSSISKIKKSERVLSATTAFRKPVCQDEKEWAITEIYSEIAAIEIRNKLIVNDVVDSVKEGRNPIILTERTEHVKKLANDLKEIIDNVIVLTGGMSKKEKKEQMQKLQSIHKEKSAVIVATGKFVGEGFDEPRLDTLFLAMPISWKETLQQYAGRLHRLYENKNEVQIYDYVDIHVGVLERMYQKRLKGYSSIGYLARSDRAKKLEIFSLHR